jgi:uncharacterized protein (TIGR00106 family)
MSVLIDFTIYPMDKGDSLSPYVARALTVIKSSGLDYKLGPMGTSIEGEWEQVMDVVNRCFEELKTDCDRVSMMLRVDYRKDTSGRIKSKVTSVENKME